MFAKYSDAPEVKRMVDNVFKQTVMKSIGDMSHNIEKQKTSFLVACRYFSLAFTKVVLILILLSDVFLCIALVKIFIELNS
jgi:predicted lipase